MDELVEVLTTKGTCCLCGTAVPDDGAVVGWQGVLYNVCPACQAANGIPDNLQKKSLTKTGQTKYRSLIKKLRQATTGGLHPRYLNQKMILGLPDRDRAVAELMGIAACIGADDLQVFASPTWAEAHLPETLQRVRQLVGGQQELVAAVKELEGRTCGQFVVVDRLKFERLQAALRVLEQPEEIGN